MKINFSKMDFVDGFAIGWFSCLYPLCLYVIIRNINKHDWFVAIAYNFIMIVAIWGTKNMIQYFLRSEIISFK